MNLLFVDTNIHVCKAFDSYFGPYENVQVFHAPFQSLKEYDCLVSPANSFGFMNGGVDEYIRQYFGDQLQDNVQKIIFEEFKGEQPVGTSIIVETTHPLHPYLAHTPTMRIPCKISGTDNVYRAMRALLVAVENFNKKNNTPIQSIACTGMGTLVGGMKPEASIRQMELAYRHFLNPVRITNWMDAGITQLEIDAAVAWN